MKDQFIENGIIFKQFYFKSQPTNYFISEYGDVYNIITKNTLSKSIDCSGRYSVCLSINGDSIPIRVHQLVASVFLGNPDENMTVDHIDENFLNNHYSNLRYVTSRENTLSYIFNNGIGDKKYSDELIHQVCKELKLGIYYRNLSPKYNIPILYLYNLVHCKCRKNIVQGYLPFPESAYRIKNDKSNLKITIYELLLKNYSNSDIYRILNIEKTSANDRLIYRLRRQFDIRNPIFLDADMKVQVEKMIKEGLSNLEIRKKLNLVINNQTIDLLARSRKKLGISDYNPEGISLNIQKEMMDLIIKGKSNKEIMEIYNIKERTKYIINLFGKLRQNVKRKSSTTIENDDMYDDSKYYVIDIH